MSCLERIKAAAHKVVFNKKGVALFIVLSCLATLAVFVGEITYTAQINQKLAYDRLDQIKAHALAKSGLRIALLRIRAYNELKRNVDKYTGNSAAAKAAANSIVPKSVLEKIWSEPVTIPFTGDISSLPLSMRDALTKFRKDSGMVGKLYIAIEAQSSKFNLNNVVPSLAATPVPSTATKTATNTSTSTASSTATDSGADSTSSEPNKYSVEASREQLTEHLREIFKKKSEDDERFREKYRNYKIEDLVQEIVGWADLSYDTLRSQEAKVPFKLAPYYDISELHYLTLMDDEVYNLISPQFNASMSQGINVNAIKESVLKSLVPQMTEDERKKFFEYRDVEPPDDHTFKDSEEFFKYLSEKVAAFNGVKSKMDDYKKNLIQRGISIVTEESHFKVRIEATVEQTKRTLEAWVSVVESPTAATPSGGTSTTPAGAPPKPADPNAPPKEERSSLKITQIRFL